MTQEQAANEFSVTCDFKAYRDVPAWLITTGYDYNGLQTILRDLITNNLLELNPKSFGQ